MPRKKPLIIFKNDKLNFINILNFCHQKILIQKCKGIQTRRGTSEGLVSRIHNFHKSIRKAKITKFLKGKGLEQALHKR